MGWGGGGLNLHNRANWKSDASAVFWDQLHVPWGCTVCVDVWNECDHRLIEWKGPD